MPAGPGCRAREGATLCLTISLDGTVRSGKGSAVCAVISGLCPLGGSGRPQPQAMLMERGRGSGQPVVLPGGG